VSGFIVTFTAPGSGASGLFSNSTASITVATNASGIAFAPFTANGTAGGPYNVTATGTGVAPVNFSLTNTGTGPASLAASLASKAGPQNARVWTIAIVNAGPGAANNAQIDSFSLVQTGGAACTPVLNTAFPLSVGTIAANGAANGNVTIDFTGCVAIARFSLTVNFSANAGAATGTLTRNNEYR